MNQHGVTFLEIIVVIAILMIVTSLVSPGLGDWRQRQALEADFYAVLSCQALGKGNLLTYQIFDKSQENFSVPSPSSSKVLEDPKLADPAFNVLSGRTKINSGLCSGNEGVFLASGQYSLKGGADRIELEIEPIYGKEKFGSYQILVHPSTGFIEKYKCVSGDANQCKELE